MNQSLHRSSRGKKAVGMHEFGLLMIALLSNFAIRFLGVALHEHPIIMQVMLLLSILVPGAILYYHLKNAAETKSGPSNA